MAARATSSTRPAVVAIPYMSGTADSRFWRLMTARHLVRRTAPAPATPALVPPLRTPPKRCGPARSSPHSRYVILPSRAADLHGVPRPLWRAGGGTPRPSLGRAGCIRPREPVDRRLTDDAPGVEAGEESRLVRMRRL